MVRLSKKTRDRSVNYKRPKVSGKKTTASTACVKIHQNAIESEQAKSVFIPKIA